MKNKYFELYQNAKHRMPPPISQTRNTHSEKSKDLNTSPSPPPANSRYLLTTLGKDAKEEANHIKQGRVFVSFQAMGQICRVFMTPWYKNPRDSDKYADKTRDERVVFEGIYMANCANYGEIMLCMVEEKLLNIKTGAERVLGIYTDTKIILRFETIAYVSFPGKNITKTGMQDVERVYPIATAKTGSEGEASARREDYQDIQEDVGDLDEVTVREISKYSYGDRKQKQGYSERRESSKERVSQNYKEAKKPSSIWANAKLFKEERDYDQKTYGLQRTAQNSSYKVESAAGADSNQAKKAATKSKEPIDEMLSQKLSKNYQRLDQKNVAKPVDEKKAVSTIQQKTKKAVYNYKEKAVMQPTQSALQEKNPKEDTDSAPSNKAPDQNSTPIRRRDELVKFKVDEPNLKLEELEAQTGKKTKPFDQFKGKKSTYRDEIYSTKLPEVTEEMKVHGERLEMQIGTGRDEEAIIRMVDESSPSMNPEEKLFAASNDGKRAKRDAKEPDYPKGKSLQVTLFQQLGATDSAHEQYLQVTKDDMRSRTNSLRNGETSKVIENLDIETRKMTQEEIEEYLKFQAKRNPNMVRQDRKLSQEYFLEEQRKLTQKLEAKKPVTKKFSCFNRKKATGVVGAYKFNQRMEVRDLSEGFVVE